MSCAKPGEVRAYRDGAGWKFRTDDVEKLATDGIPAAEPPASDISLDLDQPLDAASASAASMSDLDLDLGLDESLPSGAPSDLSLEDLEEPTVPVEGSADDDDVIELGLGDDLSDISDSILLSETELGESTDRPPSTIIGKAEMSADLDLDLAPSDSDAAASGKPTISGKGGKSKTPLADLALEADPPGMSDSFGDLEELEIDLEAESSRILAPEDVAKAKQAAAKPTPSKTSPGKKSPPKAAELSDLELAPSDSSPGALDSGFGGGSGALSGLSSLELEGGSDDEVLGDGSDITLSSESSGINIISPSDSGLALDEVPLELGGASAMGSSLDLGKGSGDEVDLEPLEIAGDEGEAGAIRANAIW